MQHALLTVPVAADRKRVAEASPRRAHNVSLNTPRERVWLTLVDDYAVRALPAAPDFVVVVEGETDRGYLQRAADQLRDATGEDLLSVPDPLRHGPIDRIALVVAKTPGDPISGGTHRMVDLARSIVRDVFVADSMGMLFLFDHDFAGRNARDDIKKYGYRPDVHTLTLDPGVHPGACTTPGQHPPEVVIEDLLPLALQQRFFDEGGANCDIQYRDGVATRFKWALTSKGKLRRYAVEHAELDEFVELRTVLSRIRRTFGFPT